MLVYAADTRLLSAGVRLLAADASSNIKRVRLKSYVVRRVHTPLPPCLLPCPACLSGVCTGEFSKPGRIYIASDTLLVSNASCLRLGLAVKPISPENLDERTVVATRRRCSPAHRDAFRQVNVTRNEKGNVVIL